jgi:hypothetical protein
VLDWLRRILGSERSLGPVMTPEPRGVHVLHDDDVITVKSPGAPDMAIAWRDLTAVRIVSGDAASDPPDLFWLLLGGERRRPVLVPMGVAGEHELVHAMQLRLDGFDNMAVVEAMSAKGPVGFKIWDADAPGPGESY